MPNPYLTEEGKPSTVLFARTVFGWEPYPYQIDPLNDNSKRILMACGRQTGKTEMAALKGLYNAVMNDNTTTLIISPTQRQSGILFRRMKQMINKNAQMPNNVKLPLENIISRETQTVIEFTNGSEVIALPAAEDGSNIRGYTSDMVIADEASRINDLVFTSAVSPMLSTTNGTLMLISTPFGVSNYFYRAFSDSLYGFKIFNFPSRVNPLITKEFLEKQRNIMPDFEYREEYLADFIDTQGVFFSLSEIDAVMSKNAPIKEAPSPAGTYYLGYDPSRFGGDEAVGIILERFPESNLGQGADKLRLVQAVELKGRSLPDQVRMIESLNEQWKFKNIVIDSTGVGAGILDPLEELDLPVEEFIFSLKSKQEVYFNLKRIIEAKEIIIPASMMKLRKQMSELKREDTPGGMTKIYHPAKTGQDDWPTALVLACWAAKTRKTVPVIFASGRGMFR